MISKELQRETDKYIKNIKNQLLCDSKTKSDFITDFKTDVFNYIKTENITDIKSVYLQFGTDGEVTKGFLETVNPSSIKKKLNWKKTVLITAIVAILIWLTAVTVALIDSHKAARGYGVESPIEEITSQYEGVK